MFSDFIGVNIAVALPSLLTFFENHLGSREQPSASADVEKTHHRTVSLEMTEEGP